MLGITQLERRLEHRGCGHGCGDVEQQAIVGSGMRGMRAKLGEQDADRRRPAPDDCLSRRKAAGQAIIGLGPTAIDVLLAELRAHAAQPAPDDRLLLDVAAAVPTPAMLRETALH